MCDGFVGLELIEPLCSRSGGTMVLYPSVQEATLPQASTHSRPGWMQ